MLPSRPAPAPEPPKPLYEVVEERWEAHLDGGESLLVTVRLTGSDQERVFSWTPDTNPNLEDAHYQIGVWAEKEATR